MENIKASVEVILQVAGGKPGTLGHDEILHLLLGCDLLAVQRERPVAPLRCLYERSTFTSLPFLPPTFYLL